MKGRLSENALSGTTIVSAPPIQEMKSGDNKDNPETSSSSSDKNHDHTGLELQVVQGFGVNLVNIQKNDDMQFEIFLARE